MVQFAHDEAFLLYYYLDHIATEIIANKMTEVMAKFIIFLCFTPLSLRLHCGAVVTTDQ